MWGLINLSLIILIGICIDVFIAVFLAIILLACYYTWIEETKPNDDKYVGIKIFIVTIAMALLMWSVDFFPGRDLTLFLIP